MTKKQVKYKILQFSDKFENVIFKILNSLDVSDISGSNSNSEIIKILENKSDEKLFNETVEYLKNHKSERSKEIALSNNESLVISID